VLTAQLLAALREVASVVEEDDGALTVGHDGTVASIRVVPIADGLEMVSLTQLLVWDIAVDNMIRARVAEQAGRTMLGTVALVEKSEGGGADVLLRYNFPGSGLSGEALRTLILMVLAGGVDARAAITG